MQPVGLVSDLDHTLFRTDPWFAAALRIGRVAFGLDVERFNRERQDRRPKAPGRVANGEGYDLFVHLATHGIAKATAEPILVRSLRKLNWLYPGAVELLGEFIGRSLFAGVLTTGSHDTQCLKRRCATALPCDISFRDLPGNKGELLAKDWTAAGGLVYQGLEFERLVVVDDSPDTFTALDDWPGLIAIQVIGRPKTPQASPLPWVHHVTRLEQIPPLLRALGVLT